MKKEQTPAVTMLPMVVKNAIQKSGENSSGSHQEILRLIELSLKGMLKAAFKNKDREERKLTEVKREASIIGALCFVSAKKMKISTELITTNDRLREVIHQSVGLDKLLVWLHRQGANKEQLLIASGKKKLIENLTNFYFTGETENLFLADKKYRKVVDELFEWLKLVKALTKSAKESPRLLRLASIVGAVPVWNSDRIFYGLIIGITLSTEHVVFSIDELQRFCTIVRDPTWSKNIAELIDSIAVEESTDRVSNSEIFKNIIADIEKPYHQTIFFISKKVAMKDTERKKISVIQANLSGAFEAITSYRFGRSSTEIYESSIKELTKTVSAVFARHPVEIMYAFMQKYPYFISFLNPETVNQLAYMDFHQGKHLTPLIKLFDSDNRMEKALEYLESKVSVGDILQQILTNDASVGIEFLKRNVSLCGGKSKKLNDDLSRSLYKAIINRIITSFDPVDFCVWACAVEKQGGDISLANTSVRRIASCYFATTPEDRPKSVKAMVDREEWEDFIDDNSRAYFRQIVEERESRKAIRVKNSKAYPIKVGI